MLSKILPWINKDKKEQNISECRTEIVFEKVASFAAYLLRESFI